MWETHTVGGVTGIKRCLGAAAIPHQGWSVSDTSYAHDENSPLLLVPPPKHAASLEKRAREAGRSPENLGSVWLRVTQEAPAAITGGVATPTTPQRKQRGRSDSGDVAHGRGGENSESSSSSSSSSPREEGAKREETTTGEEEEESEHAGQEYAAQARRLFPSSRIGADEQLVGDFGCAFRRPPLARLYGRLFVFQRHAAFHAALFGATAVAKVLPLGDIESVTAAAEPLRLIYDGIRITMSGTGKQYLFSAFSVRDEALKCLRESMERCRSETTTSGEAQAQTPDDDEGSETGDTCDAESGGGGSAQEYRTTKEAASVLSTPTVAVCVLHKLDSFQIQEAAPADSPDMEALAIGDGGATSVHLGARPEACFALFFAEGSRFIETFRTSRGDWDVRVGPWTDWKQVTGPGRLRTVQFKSPTNTSFPGAPKQTRVEETQRFRFYLTGSGDGGSDDATSSSGGGGSAKTVILDSTMAMPDVPYGDRFTLETRLVLGPSGCTAGNANSCGTDVRVLYKCNWVKSAPLVRRQIEKQSRDNTAQAYKRMCELMDHCLAGTDTRKLLSDGGESKEVSGDNTGLHRRRGMAGPARSVPDDEGSAHGKETVSVVPQREAVSEPPPKRVPMVALVLALVALAMLLQGVVTYRLGRQAGRRGE